MRRFLLPVIVVAGVFLRTADLQAWDYFPGMPWFAYGYSGSLYGLGYVPVPPYYALHPPVYYSQRVARPYGDSPFASYPSPSSIPVSPPRMVRSPFVSSTGFADATSPAAAALPSPVMIVNPYCTVENNGPKGEGVPSKAQPGESKGKR